MDCQNGPLTDPINQIAFEGYGKSLGFMQPDHKPARSLLVEGSQGCARSLAVVLCPLPQGQLCIFEGRAEGHLTKSLSSGLPTCVTQSTDSGKSLASGNASGMWYLPVSNNHLVP